MTPDCGAALTRPKETSSAQGERPHRVRTDCNLRTECYPHRHAVHEPFRSSQREFASAPPPLLRFVLAVLPLVVGSTSSGDAAVDFQRNPSTHSTARVHWQSAPDSPAAFDLGSGRSTQWIAPTSAVFVVNSVADGDVVTAAYLSCASQVDSSVIMLSWDANDECYSTDCVHDASPGNNAATDRRQPLHCSLSASVAPPPAVVRAGMCNDSFVFVVRPATACPTNSCADGTIRSRPLSTKGAPPERWSTHSRTGSGSGSPRISAWYALQTCIMPVSSSINADSTQPVSNVNAACSCKLTTRSAPGSTGSGSAEHSRDRAQQVPRTVGSYVLHSYEINLADAAGGAFPDDCSRLSQADRCVSHPLASSNRMVHSEADSQGYTHGSARMRAATAGASDATNRYRPARSTDGASGISHSSRVVPQLMEVGAATRALTAAGVQQLVRGSTTASLGVSAAQGDTLSLFQIQDALSALSSGPLSFAVAQEDTDDATETRPLAGMGQQAGRRSNTETIVAPVQPGDASLPDMNPLPSGAVFLESGASTAAGTGTIYEVIIHPAINVIGYVAPKLAHVLMREILTCMMEEMLQEVLAEVTTSPALAKLDPDNFGADAAGMAGGLTNNPLASLLKLNFDDVKLPDYVSILRALPKVDVAAANALGDVSAAVAGSLQGLATGALNDLASGAMKSLTSGAMKGLTSGAMKGLASGAMKGLASGAMKSATSSISSSLKAPRFMQTQNSGDGTVETTNDLFTPHQSQQAVSDGSSEDAGLRLSCQQLRARFLAKYGSNPSLTQAASAVYDAMHAQADTTAGVADHVNETTATRFASVQTETHGKLGAATADSALNAAEVGDIEVPSTPPIVLAIALVDAMRDPMEAVLAGTIPASAFPQARDAIVRRLVQLVAPRVMQQVTATTLRLVLQRLSLTLPHLIHHRVISQVIPRVTEGVSLAIIASLTRTPQDDYACYYCTQAQAVAGPASTSADTSKSNKKAATGSGAQAGLKPTTAASAAGTQRPPPTQPDSGTSSTAGRTAGSTPYCATCAVSRHKEQHSADLASLYAHQNSRYYGQWYNAFGDRDNVKAAANGVGLDDTELGAIFQGLQYSQRPHG